MPGTSHIASVLSCKVHLSEWKQIIYYQKKSLWQTTLLVTDWGVQSAVRSVTRVKSFFVVSNSISPSITNMGESWGQRWFRLLCYQNHSDRSSADACTEYKNSLNLMTVARFPKNLSVSASMNCESYLTGREVFSPAPLVNLCLKSGPLQIKLFDPAPLALTFAPEQLRHIDRGSCVACASRCCTISIQFISEFGGNSSSSGNKNMSTLIYVKKRLCPHLWWLCVCKVASVFLGVLSPPHIVYLKDKHGTVQLHCTLNFPSY